MLFKHRRNKVRTANGTQHLNVTHLLQGFPHFLKGVFSLQLKDALLHHCLNFLLHVLHFCLTTLSSSSRCPIPVPHPSTLYHWFSNSTSRYKKKKKCHNFSDHPRVLFDLGNNCTSRYLFCGLILRGTSGRWLILSNGCQSAGTDISQASGAGQRSYQAGGSVDCIV